MHTVIRKRVGSDSIDLESTIARATDIALVAIGAELAWILQTTPTRLLVEGAFVAFSVAFVALLFPVFGAYSSLRGRAQWRFFQRIVLGWTAVQGCVLALVFGLHRANYVSRLWFVEWSLITGVTMIAARLVVHAALAKMRRAGRNLRTVAVVGTGRHCDAVIANIAASPESGFRAMGVFNTHAETGRDHPDLPTFHDLPTFATWVRNEAIAEVWLAMEMSEEHTALSVLDEFSGDLVNLRFIPDVRSLVMFNGELVHLLGVPAINLLVSPLPARAYLQKAMFDRLFAACVLLALSPLFIAVGIAVKVSSKGPVFFTQQRKGADGKAFRILKFRTMRVHKQKDGVVVQATRGDPRVTRVGAFLRRTSLDELPQFLNVLRGEMSVVGPRPHALEHDDLYRTIVDGYIHRYRIKPGITGWAQVNGFRGETDRIEKMQRRVEHDLYYLTNWSFTLDMRIVVATAFKGLVNRNAY